jgi:hypothetical protein
MNRPHCDALRARAPRPTPAKPLACSGRAGRQESAHAARWNCTCSRRRRRGRCSAARAAPARRCAAAPIRPGRRRHRSGNFAQGAAARHRARRAARDARCVEAGRAFARRAAAPGRRRLAPGSGAAPRARSPCRLARAAGGRRECRKRGRRIRGAGPGLAACQTAAAGCAIGAVRRRLPRRPPTRTHSPRARAQSPVHSMRLRQAT